MVSLDPTKSMKSRLECGAWIDGCEYQNQLKTVTKNQSLPFIP